jgi:hypothetical protein
MCCCCRAVPAGSAVKGSTFEDQQQQQQHAAATQPAAAAAAAGSRVIITGLSSPAGDRFNVELTLQQTPPSLTAAAGFESSAHTAAAAAAGMCVRVRLGVSWLPSLPSQALQALQEVLSQQRYLQLLGACLQQPGERWSDFQTWALVLCVHVCAQSGAAGVAGGVESAALPAAAGRLPTAAR